MRMQTVIPKSYFQQPKQKTQIHLSLQQQLRLKKLRKKWKPDKKKKKQPRTFDLSQKIWEAC
jgi:hypothetical protein